MAKVEVRVEETPEEAKRRPVREASHKMFLAGVGATVVVREAIADCMLRFIERGEIVEQETRQLLRDRMERRRHQVRKVVDKRKKGDAPEAELEEQVEVFLDRMNVPTKSDIDALGAKITELTKKVDELKEA
jgi:poly(hydroxyalkanoate) granule-associated protein